MTSFLGVIDFVAILPFYLSLGIDLRSIRAFRLLRLFRLFKLACYSRAIRRFHLAFLIAREEVILFLVVTVILLYLAAVGIHHFEYEAQPEVFTSLFHSLWWAVTTLTTVGYGDTYPVTVGGRVFTFFILLIGLGVVSVPAGLVASALSKARQMEAESWPHCQFTSDTLTKKASDAFFSFRSHCRLRLPRPSSRQSLAQRQHDSNGDHTHQ